MTLFIQIHEFNSLMLRIFFSYCCVVVVVVVVVVVYFKTSEYRNKNRISTKTYIENNTPKFDGTYLQQTCFHLRTRASQSRQIEIIVKVNPRKLVLNFQKR
jgi:hypothetical protein